MLRLFEPKVIWRVTPHGFPGSDCEPCPTPGTPDFGVCLVENWIDLARRAFEKDALKPPTARIITIHYSYIYIYYMKLCIAINYESQPS